METGRKNGEGDGERMERYEKNGDSCDFAPLGTRRWRRIDHHYLNLSLGRRRTAMDGMSATIYRSLNFPLSGNCSSLTFPSAVSSLPILPRRVTFPLLCLNKVLNQYFNSRYLKPKQSIDQWRFRRPRIRNSTPFLPNRFSHGSFKDQEIERWSVFCASFKIASSDV